VADSIRRQVFRFDWAQSEPLHALLCMPAIGIPLFVALHLGYPGTGVLLSSGAMCVGFGSFQQPLFRRWGPMLAAAIGITVSAMVGAAVRDYTLLLAVIAILWAFIYGICNSLGPAAAWVGMECCVFLIISSAAPASAGSPTDTLQQALLRGAGVLSGSLLQMIAILFLWRFVPRATSTFTDPNFDPATLRWDYVVTHLTAKSIHFQFAVRMAVTMAIAVAVYRTRNFGNAYWVAMTAILLPKPEFALTTLRTIHRFAGTLLGAGLCTVLIVFVRPTGETLAILVLLFLYAGYCLLRVNYGAFVVCITGYVCFILAIVRLPEKTVLAHRIEATIIGGAIGLLVHLIFRAVRRKLHILPEID
jgi:uncharacterized membrane protein YccC